MKHTIEKRFLAVQKCLKGHAPKDVARQLGLVDDDLYVWLERYKQEGIAGLRRQPIKHADFEEKCKIVCEYEEKGVSLYRICAKYTMWGEQPSTVGRVFTAQEGTRLCAILNRKEGLKIWDVQRRKNRRQS